MFYNSDYVCNENLKCILNSLSKISKQYLEQKKIFKQDFKQNPRQNDKIPINKIPNNTLNKISTEISTYCIFQTVNKYLETFIAFSNKYFEQNFNCVHWNYKLLLWS